MKSRNVVVGIIFKENKILFGKKPLNVGPYPNTWHLIGGGVEENESLTEALKREVLEETNLKVKNVKVISTDEDETLNKHGEMIHYKFNIFTCDYESGELKPGDDIEKLEWVRKEKLKEIPLNPPSIKLFKKLNWLE